MLPFQLSTNCKKSVFFNKISAIWMRFTEKKGVHTPKPLGFKHWYVMFLVILVGLFGRRCMRRLSGLASPLHSKVWLSEFPKSNFHVKSSMPINKQNRHWGPHYLNLSDRYCFEVHPVICFTGIQMRNTLMFTKLSYGQIWTSMILWIFPMNTRIPGEVNNL